MILLVQAGFLISSIANTSPSKSQQREELKRLRNQISKYEKELEKLEEEINRVVVYSSSMGKFDRKPIINSKTELKGLKKGYELAKEEDCKLIRRYCNEKPPKESKRKLFIGTTKQMGETIKEIGEELIKEIKGK